MKQFEYITNPNTNRKCRVSSPQGRRVINNYIKRTQLGGCSAGSCALPMVGGSYNHQSGGACSLCGAEGATKATCPLNPAAKNPNPSKHPKASKSSQTVPHPKPVEKAASPKRVHQRSPSSLLVGEPSPKPAAKTPSPKRPYLCPSSVLLVDEPSPKPVARAPSPKPVAAKPVAKKTGKSCDVSQCIEITEANCGTPSILKKYKSRPSPPYPAVPCAGKKLLGKDGKTMYISKLSGKSYKWVKV